MIAGRRTRQVLIAPRGGGQGPTISLWIDPASGIVLARERWDAGGRRVFASRYLRVGYGRSEAPLPAATAGPEPSAAVPQRPAPTQPAPPFPGPPGVGKSWRSRGGPAPPGPARPLSSPPDSAPSAPPVRGPHRLTLEELRQALAMPLAEPGLLPDGFVLRGAFLPRREELRGAGIIRYSDGVRTLEVLVTRRSEARHGPLLRPASDPGQAVTMRRGRRVMAVAVRGDLVYAVSGPLPEQELQRVAASLP